MLKFEIDSESNKMLTTCNRNKTSQTHLNWSIINLVCSIFNPFSICFNIFSFKYSFKAKNSNQSGQFNNAKRFSKLARNFNLISTFLNLIGFLFILFILIKYICYKSKQQSLFQTKEKNLNLTSDNNIFSIIGIWKLKTSDNKFEQYLNEIGVNYFIRQIALNIHPTIEFHFNNETNEWTCKGSTAFKNKLDTFKLNIPFRDETFDIWSWSTFKSDSMNSSSSSSSTNKLVKYQYNDKNELFSIISFEAISENKLISISKSKTIESIASFERIDFNDYE